MWAAYSGATADCNGEGANDLVEITTRGGSPAPFLKIHSLRHAAASTPSHSIIGHCANMITV